MASNDDILRIVTEIRQDQIFIKGKVESQEKKIEHIDVMCTSNSKLLRGNGEAGLVTRLALLEQSENSATFWIRTAGRVVVTIIITALIGLIFMAS